MPARADKQTRINGIMLRNRLRFLSELFGESAREAILAALPSELSEGLRYQTIMIGRWYPVSWLVELHRAGCSVTKSGPELSRKLGYIGARENFTTVHRIFLSIVSPQALLERAPRAFRTYFDRGEMKILEKRPGYARARWSGCTGFDRNIWESVAGSCEGLLELAGAQAIRARLLEGGGDGDDWAEATAYWS